jgi:hypothetical protein
MTTRDLASPDPYSGSTPARFTASPQAAQPVFMISDDMTGRARAFLVGVGQRVAQAGASGIGMAVQDQDVARHGRMHACAVGCPP